ncbi:putative protein kinase RLK-Pelle-DLSV family [Helianthus annuus]|uniref:Protein kinase domain-containing protein n=1 Tax=Helianthus annuus TaxID=4232 RepID=A0A9K3HHB7_HELAN|nr:putative protein kinase RLK-Pelle-DLSV family [Helianthus annuus]KAJ0489752.1 putative protein kinase RLK-Pelle-DLSV family [Helianthus annuus]KAJ0505668.1 putative protein kinase RLK-Pelle-DLSV family [Helianthus annuus]KAJ0675336.1 putative protein kinase RLK-Pelle-DLSV family [Helianthus annuus]KAJ0678635.1 putative protein kinase RLK-Pelle-DLSV family [Helianthus annuus]
MALRDENYLFTHRIADRGSDEIVFDSQDRKIQETDPKDVIWDEIVGKEEHPEDCDGYKFLETDSEAFIRDENCGKEEYPGNCSVIYPSPPCFDEYGDEEWYSWFIGGDQNLPGVTVENGGDAIASGGPMVVINGLTASGGSQSQSVVCTSFMLEETGFQKEGVLSSKIQLKGDLTKSQFQNIIDNEVAKDIWDTCHIDIYEGVAWALLYLHKHSPIRVLHCDVKAKNILLDEGLEPKLHGFYFAVSAPYNETDCIMNLPRGTMVYMAPENLMLGQFSTKTDVFGFGMLVLETIAGRKRSYMDESEETFTHYLWRNWVEGTYSNIIDTRLSVDSRSIARIIHMGLWCIQTEATDRPTMEEVVGIFLGSSSTYLPILKDPNNWLKNDSDGCEEFDSDSEIVTR